MRISSLPRSHDGPTAEEEKEEQEKEGGFFRSPSSMLFPESVRSMSSCRQPPSPLSLTSFSKGVATDTDTKTQVMVAHGGHEQMSRDDTDGRRDGGSERVGAKWA